MAPLASDPTIFNLLLAAHRASVRRRIWTTCASAAAAVLGVFVLVPGAAPCFAWWLAGELMAMVLIALAGVRLFVKRPRLQRELDLLERA